MHTTGTDKVKDMGRKKTGNKLEPFVPMFWDTLHSKAYKALPPSTAKLLPYFLGKVQINPKHPEYYKMTFSFTYSEALVYGCSRRTFYGVVSALVQYGFLDPVKRGGLRGMNMSSSIFRLSNRWKQYGNAFFVEMRWDTFGMHQIDRVSVGGTK
jgi:hypothetical protein